MTRRHAIAAPSVPLDTARLDNGVTVVTATLQHASRCHVFVQLRGGPMHECDETWGLSHVVEHMVFRGAGPWPDARAVALAADDFGGDVGAATYRDRVAYDTRCDPDRLDDALLLLSQMLGAPRLRGLEVEKGIIEEELAELIDDDGVEIDIDNAVFRALFRGTALARSIEGNPTTLRRFTKAALKQHHAAFYGARNLVVSVAGPVSSSRVLQAARKTFGRLAEGHAPPVGVPPATSRARAVDVIRTDDAQTGLRLCFAIPGLHDKDATALAVLARVLDDGPASRLQASVVDREGLAYSVWAMVDAYEAGGVLEIGADVRHDRVGVLVEAIVREVVRLRRTGPTRDELARIRQRHARDLRDLLDDPMTLADVVGKGALCGQPWLPAQTRARVDAVTPRDLTLLARRHLCAPRLVLVGLPPRAQVARARAALARLPVDG